MGKIDNRNCTLQSFVDQYINSVNRLRILTGCISKGPLQWILNRLPQYSKLYIITGSIAPDLIEELNKFFTKPSGQKQTIEEAIIKDKLKIGLNKEVHMKIWLFELNKGSQSYLTIWGSSNFTWEGLWKRKGEQNDFSFEYDRFALEEKQWNHFESKIDWITKENWSNFKEKCWPSSIAQKEIKQNSNKEIIEKTKFPHLVDNIQPKRKITVDLIQNVVTIYFDIALSDLKSSKRTKGLVEPREIAMYFSRKLTPLSFAQIGEFFGGKDHSTVLHAIKRVEKKLDSDKHYLNEIELIKDKILSSYEVPK